MRQRKGTLTLGDAPGIAITLVMVGTIFVSGFLIVSGLQDNVSYDQDPAYSASASNGCNSTDTHSCTIFLATENITLGMLNVTSYMPVIGVIVGVAILLGLVLAGFGLAKGRGML